MKLSLAFAAAFTGCVAALERSADVYMLPSPGPETSSSPALSRDTARLVFMQRLAASGKAISSVDFPTGMSTEDVASVLRQYGKTVPQLFGNGVDAAPSQLVLMLDSASEEDFTKIGQVLRLKSAFTISEPPSRSAHESLIHNDFYNAGVTNMHKCQLSDVINPFNEDCWSGMSTVAMYNIGKNPDVIDELERAVKQLKSLAEQGEMETTIVVLPPVSASARNKQWSAASSELRRRQSEQIISSKPQSAHSPAPTSSKAEHPVFFASQANIPSCFTSEDSCSSATKNCSGHGVCQNKYANPDGSEGREACFTCHCLSTASKQGGVTHWAGAACTKKDISVPFWLFAGFTLAMVGILSLAVGMLFSVGEEKLPGVIGAGVSRSK